MDPYAETEDSCLKKLFPSAPFGEWNMPEGFTSLWLDEEAVGDEYYEL